jgi:hypothetical protein
MVRKLILGALFIAGMLLVVGALPRVEAVVKITEFKADFTDESSFRPEKKIIGKVYVKGVKSRREAMKNGKLAEISIFRPDKKLIWILNVAQKTYIEMKMPTSTDAGGLDAKIKEMADIKQLGQENVNGYLCNKVQYVYKNKQLGTLTSWVAIKLNYMIKMLMVSSYGTTKMNYTNIKEGRQADALFELPGGYKLVKLPF